MAFYRRIRGILSCPYLFNRLKTLISNQQRWNHTSGKVMEIDQVEGTGLNPSAWKIVDSRTFGINKESVLPSILVVLKTLQTNGYGAYLVGGLFLDPFRCKIYDFVGGLKDLRASKVSTVNPPHLAFKEDCAKILRGMRIAARLGLQFSKETETAIQDLSSSILTLNKERLMLEMNFMMAHGAAAPSINLLKKFKLLEILLPAHAAYLTSQSNNLSAQRSTMLTKLLMNADKLLRADHPCSCNLWLGLLAFHLALVHNPQDSFVIWTFSSILYHGTWNEAVAFVKGSSDDLIHFVPEILPPSIPKPDELLLEEISRFAALVKASVEALTDSKVLQQSLAKYSPLSSSQCLVFVSPKMGRKVSKLFDVLDIYTNDHGDEEENLHVKEKNSSKRKKAENLHTKKKRERYDINYELLKNGDLNETRFLLGKIIMDTMKGEPIAEADKRMAEGENEIIRLSSLFQ